MAGRARKGSWVTVLLLVVACVWWLLDQTRPEERVGGISDSGYERIDGCRWVAHPRNDGDSFRLKLPDGRVEEFRLYFADAPESAFRTYGGGRSNRQRIGEQAADMWLSPEAAVEVGKRASARVERELSEEPITIFTEWDDPFGDERYHAFVELPGGGWVHELLVSEGLARVHTKGAPVPGGAATGAHRRHLEKLESEAFQKRR